MNENKIVEEIIDLTKDLIRFKTMHKNMDQIHDCIRFIENYLNQNEIKFHRYTINGYPSILVTPFTKKIFLAVNVPYRCG